MKAPPKVGRVAAKLGEILLDPRILRTVVEITQIPAESGFGGEGHGGLLSGGQRAMHDDTPLPSKGQRQGREGWRSLPRHGRLS
ncbi:hypothetical protein D3C87_1990520 [compost metagenome]